MSRAKSGPLRYHHAKGLLFVDELWWVDTGLTGRAFRLVDHDGSGTSAELHADGTLRVHPGYPWDGSSRPLVRDKSPEDAESSLAHDVLYEAIRSRKLHQSSRAAADALYREMQREAGRSWLRSWNRWFWLRVGGWRAGSPKRAPQYPRRVSRQ